MITCPRCFGRGYKPEARKNNRGFYARTCPRCGGCGQVEEARAYFLRYQSEYLEDATRYATKRAAVAAYLEAAQQLARFGQALEASLHIANSREELQEYPDFVLSLGPRGGLHLEAA